MTLREAIERYIEWKRAHGAKFHSEAKVLYRFGNLFEPQADCDSVSRIKALGFLAGNGPLTSYRRNKYSVLNGFYRFALARGYARHCPLPLADQEPKPPPPLPPYVFSKAEVGRLTDAAMVCQSSRSRLDAETFRTLLLLLYGTGLRISEALKLTLKDVDLKNALLTVSHAKFYKHRWVPTGTQLTAVLSDYAQLRAQRPMPNVLDSPFLVSADGAPLTYGSVSWAFSRLLRRTGILCLDNGCRNPSLHSLRHTFAVHRLTAWYQQGQDVQRLLPALSTYLGHADLDGTKVYLTMTPELLHEASDLFDQYVNGGAYE